MQARICITKTELFKTLQEIGKIISSRPINPAHENFLFKIEESGIAITGADQEGNITKAIECDIESDSDGSFMINHKILLDGLKVLSEQPVTLNIELTDRKSMLLLEHSNGSYQLPILRADDFPLINNKEINQTISFQGEQLVEGLEKVIGFSGTDDLRPILSSVLIESKLGSDQFRFVGTNSSILAVYEIYGKPELTEFEFRLVIPIKMAKIILNIISGTDSVIIKLSRQNLTLVFDDTVFTFRKPEGEYPNYRAIIPTQNNQELIASKKDLQGTIKRTAIFSNRSSGLITFEISPESLVVGAKDLDFKLSAQETIRAEFTNSKMSIGFRYDLILQCLSAIDNEQVRITMKDAISACLVTPFHQEDQSTLTILIMPMMINY